MALHRRARRRTPSLVLVGVSSVLVMAMAASFAVAEDELEEGGSTRADPGVSAGTQATPTRPSTAPPHSAMHATTSVYAADRRGGFSPAVRGVTPRVYVPITLSGVVDEIDPKTFQVVKRIQVGGQPHHVTPSWDLRHLYVDNPGSDLLQVIDPRTGDLRRSIRVASPYNLYFTPDGSKAIVVAEYDRLMEFRDPHTWRVMRQVRIPWSGVDHMDFSRSGKYLLVSCEYTGVVVRVDTRTMRVTGTALVGGLPIDVKVSPNGHVFFVANQGLDGVSVIDPWTMKQVQFIPTGRGAHGFAVSRDGRFLYVSNRLAGTISVIRFADRKVVAAWNVGGSPDMLQVSPDGTQLWMSNRFGDTVSVISTRTGRVLHEITVGPGPHGLAYFPQPGRHSIGHNGVYR